MRKQKIFGTSRFAPKLPRSFLAHCTLAQ